MRQSNIFKKTNRRTKKRKRDVLGCSFKDYRKVAAAQRKRAIERLFGSQGAASPVRKIDPKTGQVIETIDAH